MKIPELYRILFGQYGEQHWWPSRTGARWEIASGAVLTQNCAWTNVEKALGNLVAEKLDTPDAVLDADPEKLRAAIRPAGFFMQKSVYLKELAGFFLKWESEYLESHDVPNLRKRLLAVKGIGRETADCILLYCFGQPVFVIDAYTRRVSERHLQLNGSLPYDELQKIFLSALPRDIRIYSEYHALLVRLCKESCLKKGCRCCTGIGLDSSSDGTVSKQKKREIRI